MEKFGVMVFIVYLVMGFYLINFALNIIPIPDIVQGINKWIVLIGGILVIFGGISYLRASTRNYSL